MIDKNEVLKNSTFLQGLLLNDETSSAEELHECIENETGLEKGLCVEIVNMFYCLHPKLRNIPAIEFMDCFFLEVVKIYNMESR